MDMSIAVDIQKPGLSCVICSSIPVRMTKWLMWRTMNCPVFS